MKQIAQFSFLLSLFFVFSCACPLSEKDRQEAQQPMEFEKGVRYLAKEVLCAKPFSFGKKTVRFNVFQNETNKNELKDQPDIERIMTDEFKAKLSVPAPGSSLDSDFLLNGWLKYESNESGKATWPVLTLQMIDAKKETVLPVGSVRFENIGHGLSKAGQAMGTEVFQEDQLKSGIQYIAKETLAQLEQDSFAPGKKSVYFAKVHNYRPHYVLKNKAKIISYMMDVLNVKFTLPDTTDFKKVDYVLKAYLFHDKTSEKNKEVVHRFQVQAFDARTGVRVSTAQTTFDYFDIEPLIPAAYSRPPTEDETDFVTGEGLDPEQMDIAFRVDTLAEQAFALEGTEGRDDEIVTAYLKLIEKIGENDRFKGELQDAYTNLFGKLYQMGKKDEAKEYLMKMLPLAIENSSTINFSPRFKVNSAFNFVKIEEEFYNFNLKVLSEFLFLNPSTVLIYGHTSITDIQGVNCRLSYDRGVQILNLLKKFNPDVDTISEFTVRGRSFIDCDICQGEDEYDRRVSFRFIQKNEGQTSESESIDDEMLMKCLEYGKRKLGLDYYDRHPNFRQGRR